MKNIKQIIWEKLKVHNKDVIFDYMNKLLNYLKYLYQSILSYSIFIYLHYARFGGKVKLIEYNEKVDDLKKDKF